MFARALKCHVLTLSLSFSEAKKNKNTSQQLYQHVKDIKTVITFPCMYQLILLLNNVIKSLYNCIQCVGFIQLFSLDGNKYKK